MEVTYTHYFSKRKPLSKLYRLEDGKIIKEPAAQMYSGVALKITSDFADFATALEDADSNTAFGYGLFDNLDRDRMYIVTAKQEQENSGLYEIARNKDNFSYQDQPGILMLDYDPSEYGPGYTHEEVIEILGSIHPPLLSAARIVRGSVSAGVHREGEHTTAGKGFHIYIPVQNAADIPRYGAVLFDRLWLSGLGFIALAKNGANLVRSILDNAVFSPERLDFVGSPILEGDGLAYTPTPIEYSPGECLDTTKLLDLTTKEISQVKRLQSDAKEAILVKSQIQQAKWTANKVQEMQQNGSTLEQAQKVINRILSSECHELCNDYLLQFAYGLGGVTVEEVLKNPEQYDGQALADPIEGAEYGSTTAKFFWNDEGVRIFV